MTTERPTHIAKDRAGSIGVGGAGGFKGALVMTVMMICFWWVGRFLEPGLSSLMTTERSAHVFVTSVQGRREILPREAPSADRKAKTNKAKPQQVSRSEDAGDHKNNRDNHFPGVKTRERGSLINLVNEGDKTSCTGVASGRSVRL